MDEKLYRFLMGRMANMQVDIFAQPPKTMEEFRERLGAFKELTLITNKMAEEAKGKEKD